MDIGDIKGAVWCHGACILNDNHKYYFASVGLAVSYLTFINSLASVGLAVSYLTFRAGPYLTV